MIRRSPRPPSAAQLTINFNFAGSGGGAASPAAEAAAAEPETSFDLALRAALAKALETAEAKAMDREAVAQAMSRIVGRTVSKTNLDQWVAPSQGDRRPHVDHLRAVCLVTGDFAPLRHLVEACGFVLMRPDDARLARFGAMMLIKRQVARTESEIGQSFDEGYIADLVGRLQTGELA